MSWPWSAVDSSSTLASTLQAVDSHVQRSPPRNRARVSYESLGFVLYDCIKTRIVQHFRDLWDESAPTSEVTSKEQHTSLLDDANQTLSRVVAESTGSLDVWTAPCTRQKFDTSTADSQSSLKTEERQCAVLTSPDDRGFAHLPKAKGRILDIWLFYTASCGLSSELKAARSVHALSFICFQVQT
ncbi:hypothetical protein BKA80DRAFT_259744 [Phyllosticta citrichinensis]